MLRRFFVRDRMVMTGLIVMGLFIVAAGFASGRSTFEYALYTDARLATRAWVESAERQLRLPPGDTEARIAEDAVRIIAPDRLAAMRETAARLPADELRIAAPAPGGSGLMGSIDRVFAGWIRTLTELLDADGQVGKVMDFAILDASGHPVLRNEAFAPASLAALLSSRDFRAEFHKTLGTYSSRIVDEFPFPQRGKQDFQKLILVPIIEKDSTVARVYVLEMDQSSAATMSKAALVAASMMTSLLIVMGYSVPAAIAFRRIRERWQAESQIRFLAMHDPLTSLPNRMQLEHRLDEAVARTKRRGSLVAVMCLDLDRFKEVNDTLGHQTGDELLRQAADRLRACVRETDVVSRLGGDEFTLVVEDVEKPDDMVPVARRICDELARPFEVNGHVVTVSGSIGISLGPMEGVTPSILMNNADLALYRAKNDGRNTFRFFEAEMDRAVRERRRLANDLRRALRNNELTIHYQPQFDLRTGHLNGYEALARWPHPEEGLIPPDVFIPIAEEAGMIGILGEWVLNTACRYAANWPDSLVLAVNVSSAQFGAQDIVATVRAALEESGLPASRLMLEVTETVLMKNSEESIQDLERLNDLGISLALDDFGTGYSSLSYLTRFPVRKIKIDRSFVENIGKEGQSDAVIGTIVGLGKTLNVTITAEGVETVGQAQYLRDLGCAEVQGFLFGRPRPKILRARPEDFAVAAGDPQPIPVEPVQLHEHAANTGDEPLITRQAS